MGRRTSAPLPASPQNILTRITRGTSHPRHGARKNQSAFAAAPKARFRPRLLPATRSPRANVCLCAEIVHRLRHPGTPRLFCCRSRRGAKSSSPQPLSASPASTATTSPEDSHVNGHRRQSRPRARTPTTPPILPRRCDSSWIPPSNIPSNRKPATSSFRFTSTPKVTGTRFRTNGSTRRGKSPGRPLAKANHTLFKSH